MTPQDPQPSPSGPAANPPADGPPPDAPAGPPPSDPPDPPPPDPADPPPPGPPPPPDPPRRLTRSAGDKVLGGVASGLARHLGADPALVRLGFVVLALFGGSGIALYAILWLLLPSDDASAVAAPQGLSAGKAVLAALAALAIVWVLFTGPVVFVTGPALLPLAVAAALGVVTWRALGGEGHPSLVRAAWFVLAVAGALALGLAAGVAAAFGAGTAVAVAVIAAGLAMIAGGLLGGARWLVIPALVMAVPLSLVAAADIDLTGGVGERDHRPASPVELSNAYRLGVGELRLDLRDVDLPVGPTDLDVRVGVGRVEVTVPEDVCVQLDGHVGAGAIEAFERTSDGLDVHVDRRPAAAGEASILRLRARAGVGHVEVDHVGGLVSQPACWA